MLGRLIANSLTVLLLLVAYGEAQPVDPGPVRVGDRWSYDIKDDLTGDLRRAITVVVADRNDNEITTRVSVRGKDRPQTMIYDPDWGRIDDGAWKLRPSGIGIKKPLEIGKEWRSDAKRDEFAIRHRSACGRGCKGRRAGTDHGAGRNVRHVSDRHDRENDQHERPNQIPDLDLCRLVRPRGQSVGQEEIGVAFRGAAQRLIFRGADRIFAIGRLPPTRGALTHPCTLKTSALHRAHWRNRRA